MVLSTEFDQKLVQMRLTIAPILGVKSGKPPPDFPSTLLNFFLLTERQLDAMAVYYSQCGPPTAETYMYPSVMNWNRPLLSNSLPEGYQLSACDRLKVKMRMFAGFIGMSGAEMPMWENQKELELVSGGLSAGIIGEDDSVESKGPPRMY
jgi:hypothetical protein